MLLASGVLLLIATLLLGDRAMVASALIAYFSSALVVLSSFKNYERMVRRRLEAGDIPQNESERDLIDKIEDPFDLYSESEVNNKQTSIKEVIKEEKRHLKRQRRSFSQTTKDTLPAFSFWRLGSYAILVAGFFLLQAQHLFNIGAYLISLDLPLFLRIFNLVQRES